MLDEFELQERLLAELEEAGEENIPTLANTVFADECANSDEKRIQMKNALASLINADLVRVAFDDGSGRALIELSKERSYETIMQFHMVLRSDDGTWTGGLRPWPEIVTTEIGKMQAQGILKARGYRWWSK